MNKECPVMRVRLEKQVHLEHQEKMLSAFLELMVNLVPLVNLVKMEKKENLDLLVPLVAVVLTKLSSMANVLRHYSIKLDSSRRGSLNVAMDIIKGMLNLMIW